jgi:hypothetical protein
MVICNDLDQACTALARFDLSLAKYYFINGIMWLAVRLWFEFGFVNCLRFFGLWVNDSETDPTQVRHTLGLVLDQVPAQVEHVLHSGMSTNKSLSLAY